MSGFEIDFALAEIPYERLVSLHVAMEDFLAALRELGGVYRAVMGRNFPAMTMVEVKALVEDRARVEIEATAVL